MSKRTSNNRSGATSPAAAPATQGVDRRRESIVKAATAVFAERGFHGATTREIAERAGCSKGLIYFYFEGKRDLLLAVIGSSVERIRQHEQPELGTRAGAEAEINGLLRERLEHTLREHEALRVSLAQAIVDRELGEMVGRTIQRQAANELRNELLHYQELGALRDDLELEAGAHMLAALNLYFGVFGQIVWRWDEDEIHQLLAACSDIFFRGVVSNRDATSESSGRPDTNHSADAPAGKTRSVQPGVRTITKRR